MTLDVHVERTALVLMHLQDDITTLFPVGDMTPFIARCAQAIETCRRAGVRIFFVNIKFSEDYREISARNRNGMWLKSMGSFRHGKVTPQINLHEADVVLEAQRINVFLGTALEAHLRAANIDTLIMGGVTTSGVLVSSLPHASDLDYRVLAIRDCCYDPDSVAHEAIFASAFSTRAEIISVQNLPALLRV